MKQRLNYLSVCSGIGTEAVAWRELPFRAIGFAEIDPFASAILEYHYPKIPNFKDLTKHALWTLPNKKIDLLIAGTPCQPFSRAGKRKGLDDSRTSLAGEFCRLAALRKPRWLIWENVADITHPTRGKNPLKAIITALEGIGYGLAWRSLNALEFGHPQHRYRTFVIGYMGNWRPAGAVLLDPKSSTRNFAPPSKSNLDELGITADANCPRLFRQINYSKYDESNYAGPLTTSRGRFDIVLDIKGLRRLTPCECERLMGLPDGYTMIPWQGKPATDCPPTKRIAAIGNAIATGILTWLGSRIAAVDYLFDLAHSQGNTLPHATSAYHTMRRLGMNQPIATALRERGTNMSQIAKQLGVTTTAVTQVVKASSKPKRSQRIENAIAKALGLPVEQVFQDRPYPPTKRGRPVTKVITPDELEDTQMIQFIVREHYYSPYDEDVALTYSELPKQISIIAAQQVAKQMNEPYIPLPEADPQRREKIEKAIEKIQLDGYGCAQFNNYELSIKIIDTETIDVKQHKWRRTHEESLHKNERVNYDNMNVVGIYPTIQNPSADNVDHRKFAIIVVAFDSKTSETYQTHLTDEA